MCLASLFFVSKKTKWPLPKVSQFRYDFLLKQNQESSQQLNFMDACTTYIITGYDLQRNESENALFPLSLTRARITILNSWKSKVG